MLRFELRGITQDGRLQGLALEAPDEAAARRLAADRGLTVLKLRERAGFGGLALLARREAFPVVLFTQELIALLDAGLPLVEAVDTLAEKERAAGARAVLGRLSATLREGRSFSAALEAQPESFPALYAATVRAAERTSDLQPALARYVAYRAQMEAVRRRVINASIYPALLVGVGFLVSLFLLLYVVPRFSRIYEDRGAELPLFSRLLLSWGGAVEGHGLLIAVTLAALGAALAWALSRPAARAALQDALWRLPSVGERMRIFQLARFYRTIGMLLRGGMPVVASLELGAELLHPVLRRRLAAATRAISEGQPISAAMEANHLTSAVALRLLAVGEQGGNMGEMMERIAAFHDEEMTRWIEWLTRLAEPLLMAAIGIVIGGIVVVMYMPIFELAGGLG